MATPRARLALVGIITATLVVAGWRLTVNQSTEEIGIGNTLGSSVGADTPEAMPMVEDRVVVGGTPSNEDEADEAEMVDNRPRAPLTGLPIEDGQVDELNRPALVVKVDNHPSARPQTGLDQADIVFDYRAEGVTRFSAVFHSTIPDPVGPVRSSRTSDFDLLRGLDTPLYASSGGNDYVTAGLRKLPIVELTNRTRTEYYRDFSRPAPHNLFVMGSDLYALAADRDDPPQPWFTYRSSGDAGADTVEGAVAAAGPVRIGFTGSPVVSHVWDGDLNGWLRSQDGRPHLTAAGDQLAPENVVIMVTSYRTSPADAISPEVISVGEGPLWVLTDGMIIEGTWSRPSAEEKPTLTTPGGEEITLTPGRTWVLMPEAGQVTVGG